MKKMSRREAIGASGATLAGLSLGTLKPGELLAQPQQQPSPDRLVETPLRNIAPLPLNPDGSAPEHAPEEAGPISGRKLWRYTDGQPPEIEYDYRKMRIKIDPRRGANLAGTLTFGDLERLPRHSAVYLLQCGAPEPRGIVKWTGVRFSEFAEMLGVQPFTHYCRIIGSDRYWVEEDMNTMMHPQVMLAWLMNDERLPPEHGAPLRLIIPFRYGARSIKAITEIYLGATGFPLPEFPG